jgi:alkylated DNA nucleotide flippase Atl1
MDSTARRQEVEVLLRSDTSRVGEIWRLQQEGLRDDEIARHLQIKTPTVWAYTKRIEALRDGEFRDDSTYAGVQAQKIRSWLKEKPLSSDLRESFETDLVTLAATIEEQTFQEDALHRLLRNLPVGRWATYGDVAELVGTSTMGLSSHIKVCTACANCHKILQKAGTISPQFRWADPDDRRDPRVLLESEGLRFIDDQADPARQVHMAELVLMAGLDLVDLTSPFDAAPTSTSDSIPLPMEPGISGTDAQAITNFRTEQSKLREYLLRDQTTGTCGICGRILPAGLLVAAHIHRRSLLTDAERLDFTAAAMLACSLGCDALFERGYIVVDDKGQVRALRTAAADEVTHAVAQISGMQASAFNARTAGSFARHRDWHNERLVGR